ncbi:predicted protein [Aspergillus terreus NIH2624]|jgi:hypothetical protein|uniref:Uncharacterized protein n=1 Tax=Aspergillus terreus (strain NIH 2624 / FGSC A1156) TaxID=341663 RepID=Q0CI88_ASPTN|nr:uncharacterized protein ATEG_06596 [Aspergillus terreus NIH2624]EAU33140.1 predicted protein [Aspergillus terreus NIH2624]
MVSTVGSVNVENMNVPVIWRIPTKMMSICQMSEVRADGEVHGRMLSVVVESSIYRGNNSAVCLPFAHNNAAVPQAADADHASPDLVPRLVTWVDARTDLELQQLYIFPPAVRLHAAYSPSLRR